MSTAATTNATEKPNFFSVLSSAEEIQVQELDSKDHLRRSFLVNIRAQSISPKVELPDKPDRNYVLQSAQRLIDSNDYLLARNLYSYLLKTNLRDREALFGLGISLFRLGDAAGSARCFRACWEVFSVPESLYWLGLAQIQLKEESAAIDTFSTLAHPEKLESSMRYEFHREFGNCLTRKGDLEKAEQHYLSALQLRPHSDAIMVNLGTLEIQRENTEKAECYFQDALTLNPNNSKAHCGLGILALVSRRQSEAERRFLVALDLDSQNQAALLELVSIAHQQNSFIQIKPRLARFLLKEPTNHNIRYQLAVCLYRESHWRGCEKEVDYILANDPRFEPAIKLKQTILNQKHNPGVSL